QPDQVTSDMALRGTNDCQLVRLEATVLDRARHVRDEFLVLQSGGFIFQAYFQSKQPGADFSVIQNESKVAVTGVCLIEKGGDWFPSQNWRAHSFRLLLRSPDDILLLQSPPWWTLKKLLWAVSILGAVMLCAFAWVVILRRRVHQQTGIIRQKL